MASELTTESYISHHLTNFTCGKTPDGWTCDPYKVEYIQNELSHVDEAAIFGILDNDLGGRVVAAIVLEDNKNFNQSKTGSFVNDKLARYKQPKKYFIMKSLPRNAMGEVKNELRKRFYTKNHGYK